MLFCTTLIVIVLVCILLLELTLGFYFLDNLFSYEKFCKDYLRIRKNVQNFIFLQQELKLFQQYVFFFLTDLVKSIDPVYQSITNFDFDELDLLNRGLYIPNFLEYIFYIIVFIPTLFVHFIKIVTIILANSEIENQLNPLFELVVFAINFILYIFISNNFIFEWFVSNLLDLPPIYVNGQKLPGGLMYAHILYLIIRIQF